MPTRRECLLGMVGGLAAAPVWLAGRSAAVAQGAGPGEQETVALAGDPAEVGRRFGRLNAVDIRSHVIGILDTWRERGLSDPERDERTGPLMRFIARFAPAWMDEIEATARAADVPVDEYLAFLAGKYRDVFFVDECTSFAAVGSASADGATLFHKNRDNVSRPQCAYAKKVRHASRPAAFHATGDTSDLGVMMMVNEHGLAGSADMTSPLREKRPTGRGVANPYILRLIAERAESCQHALEIVQQMVRDGWYAGGKKAGTHWLFADRSGKALRVAQNAVEEQHWWVEDDVVFLVREKTSPAKALVARRGRITLADMNATATHPEICFKSSISAMTVRIDPKQPAALSAVWFALPAWSAYVPLFAVAESVPRALADGRLYDGGYRLLESARIVGRAGVCFVEPLASARKALQEQLYAEAAAGDRAVRGAIDRGDTRQAAAAAIQCAGGACARALQHLAGRLGGTQIRGS